ncbi:MAG: hypothetical protein PHV59_01105 [Victivallales bacterium]|nr:hypothetical protein [Victivallales bacterium]
MVKSDHKRDACWTVNIPAEESKGGKIIPQDHNVLDGIDALMMVYPLHCTKQDTRQSGNVRCLTGKTVRDICYTDFYLLLDCKTVL